MSGATDVRIGDVRPHPKNPRKGNVSRIADSLRVNGQYKPILVNSRNNQILAGTHTWKAAKTLGWATISATHIDADEATALSILLADNRAADAGWTDEDAAMELLQALPDLAGTGYTEEDLNLPDYDPEWLPDDEPADGDGEPQDQSAPAPVATVPIWVGAAKGEVAEPQFKEWRAGYPRKASAAFEEVCKRLGLTEEVEETTGHGQPNRVDVQTEKLASLVPYPGNPRQGDVGTIVTLLRTHGQFRPIVVSTNTRRILAGNHVAMAAEQLGWTEIAVSWVTTDEEGERRIVLADNRTSDLATYDTEKLGQAILGVPVETLWEATGYSLQDVQELVGGETPAAPAPTAEATLRIGDIRGKVRLGLLQELNLTRGAELIETAAILGLEGLQE